MKTRFISRAGSFFLLALIFCLNGSCAYGLVNLMGNKINLDLSDGWYSRNDPESVGLSESHEVINSIGDEWSPITLRDYWTRHSVRHEDAGATWYAKTFYIDNPGSDLVLYVSGVDDDASFYLNGQAIGNSTGYSEDVTFNAGSSLKSGENILAARLNRPVGTENIYSPVVLVHEEDLPKVARLDSSLGTARPSEDWVRDAVVYELYPRSFSKDESFKSVEKQIPELKKLGVTVLWIMPIHPLGW